jgi:hypothetical protein
VRRAWPIIVVLLAGCATLRSLFREERPLFVPPEAAYVTGAHARAVGVAYEDWMAYRANITATREAIEDAGDSGLKFPPEAVAIEACYNRPDAYQTWIWSNDAGTSYFVDILHLEGTCFPREEGPPYYGDFMTYEIDAKTFQILKREVEEK